LLFPQSSSSLLHHPQSVLPHFCQSQERQQDFNALVFLFLKTHYSSFHIVCLILSMWPPHHWLIPLSNWQWQKDLFHSSSNITLQYDLIQNNMNIWVHNYLSYALLYIYHMGFSKSFEHEEALFPIIFHSWHKLELFGIVGWTNSLPLDPLKKLINVSFIARICCSNSFIHLSLPLILQRFKRCLSYLTHNLLHLNGWSQKLIHVHIGVYHTNFPNLWSKMC
jgi:hypothetical protein